MQFSVLDGMEESVVNIVKVNMAIMRTTEQCFTVLSHMLLYIHLTVAL